MKHRIALRGDLGVIFALVIVVNWGCTKPQDAARSSAASNERNASRAPVLETRDEPRSLPDSTTPEPSTPDPSPTIELPRGPIQLVDATERSGVTFRHSHGGSGKNYIVETVSAGLATFDYDGDGWIDLLLLNGAPLRGTSTETPPRHALYRNQGGGKFVDVTELAGLDDRGYGLGVTVADYDNDGDPDVYFNHFGPNALYANNGDGTFSNVTASCGIARGDKVGAGACFLDMDADGDLDLFSANYLDFTYENHVDSIVSGIRYAHPKDYRPVPDDLFRNNGDGTWSDVSESSGLRAVAGMGMGAVCFDYDDDHDADIFVANDVGPNFLYQNDGKGQFVEVAATAGVAFDFSGRANASMGVECGDYDNDGRLDLFVTDYADESAVLYRNLGGGFLEDVSSQARAGIGSYPHVKWGAALADLDNDGDRDLFVANGHILEGMEKIDDRTAYRAPNTLLMNEGNGRFVDVTRQSGTGLAPVESSRGVAFDDLDNDGDVDGVVQNANAPPTLLWNESPEPGNWIALRLCGRTANRDAVGARVRIVGEGFQQVAEVHSGRSYQSHYGQTLHFGLGAHDRLNHVEVRWPGGETETFRDVIPNQANVLIEETSSP
jgi:hypothetical protein